MIFKTFFALSDSPKQVANIEANLVANKTDIVNKMQERNANQYFFISFYMRSEQDGLTTMELFSLVPIFSNQA